MSKCYAKAVVAKALEEVGYIEKKTNSQLVDKTANAGANNWNKYADYIDKNYPVFYNGKKNGYAWCDVFVDYLFISTYGYENALRLLCQPEKSCGAGCTWSYGYYNSKSRASKNPIVGAQVFFTYDGGKTCGHTGIVVKYDATTITTVEGNSGDKVAMHTYNRNDSIIVGYGVPDYDAEETKEAQTFNVEVDASKYNQICIKLV